MHRSELPTLLAVELHVSIALVRHVDLAVISESLECVGVSFSMDIESSEPVPTEAAVAAVTRPGEASEGHGRVEQEEGCEDGEQQFHIIV